MTTMDEFAKELNQRAAGWRARSHTIFNGAIIAEELQGWADKAAALASPEPTEAQIEAVLNAYHDMGVEGAWPQKARNMMRAALRAMTPQDGAVTQDKRADG